ncbi:glutamine-hydrolyzing GMP synthase [Sporosarcina sp. P37]|uniref:glutamine-hydrolyzing GMP synthase n=1 Tax=unclassified Sporosarcina TaxID=2647733 RepID=UPI000A17DBD1|nr:MULTISPECIES: glutamine-hydrolyzing GMP synthase [unclassified Sporosarcina]ARK24359.1 glutamine-hydrolyzing GMP synthase [Sporosarcina sp. P37]PID17438.1 glutamine-hydrolyzing GMP synthase [Sporosarcina sp. P35]
MSNAPLLVEQEKIVVLDYGSQYNQLFTRTIREFGVYSELHAHTTTVEELKEMNPVGIVLSGGTASAGDAAAYDINPEILKLGIPVLGISYGTQLIVEHLGGTVEVNADGEGKEELVTVDTTSALFAGQTEKQNVWVKDSAHVAQLPDGFTSSATDSEGNIVAVSNDAQQIYAIQFHPEEHRSEHGKDFLRHFVFEICKAKGDWTMERFIEIEVEKIRSTVGDRKVLCALSGGVDSSVVAALIDRAIGDQLTCIFVDHGLLRKGEVESVVKTFSEQFSMHFIKVDARKRFLDKLAGVTEPEQKRKIIGNEFIYVFDEESAKLDGIKFLAQGTIYADIIESGTATSATIKSHHNVGGLPEDMDFELIEPLRALFKDEVRAVGAELGLPEEIVNRQPFPGPGLGVRVLGEITEDKLEIVRDADFILRDEIAKAGLDRSIWQYFAVLPNIRSVGVRNEQRSYDYAIGIRAVHSVDGMTADWARIPWDVLEKISTRITSEVDQVNRVVYDITAKPPGTIEWE